MITCIGGCHVDIKAVAAGGLVPGTSNPVSTDRTPGGVACNVARWVARLGWPVRLVSLVGADAIGDRLRSELAGEGIDTAAVLPVPDVATATYTAVIDGAGSLALGLADMTVYERMDAAWAVGVTDSIDGPLVIDTNPSVEALQVLAAVDVPVYADPVSVDKSLRLRPVLDRLAGIFPDRAEAEALTGHSDPERAVGALLAAGAGLVVVSLGADGIVLGDSEGVRRRPAVTPQRVVDVTGAGDAMVGATVFALTQGEDDPVGWGLAAASLAVATRESVPEVSRADLEQMREQ